MLVAGAAFAGMARSLSVASPLLALLMGLPEKALRVPPRQRAGGGAGGSGALGHQAPRHAEHRTEREPDHRDAIQPVGHLDFTAALTYRAS